MKMFTREELLDGIDWVERCVLEVSGETLAQWRQKWGESAED